MTNELDILKLEKELLKNYVPTENTKLFNVYKNCEKRNIINRLIILLPIQNIVMGGFCQCYPFYGLAALSLFSGLKSIKSLQTAKIKQEIKEEIIEQIKTTDTYKNLENEYLSYITTLASFIKKIGMTSGIQVALFYNFLLDFGYLSKSHHHQYEHINKKRENEMLKYEIPELLGSRVATGESVCRHMASMLSDLENEIGNKAINLPVSETKNINKDSKNSSKRIIITTHLTSIIQDHKTKLVFGYCPTNNEIFRMGTINQNVMLENNNRKYLSYNILDIIDNDHVIIYNRKYLENLEAIFSDSLKEEKDIKLHIPLHETLSETANIISYFFKNQRELEEFYQSSKEQLEKIDSLLNQLYPQEYNNQDKVIKYTIK